MRASSGTVRKTTLSLLILGSLGVVFGDIGTSPLYAVTQIFFGQGQVGLSEQNILGAIGLIIWALTAIATLKYIVFVLLADHEGQGGVFALLGLLSGIKQRKSFWFITILLVLAAGLLFGEGVITPSISILSAVEGLSLATSYFTPYIIPITLIILTILFALQYKGTGNVGIIFGPIMFVWFVVIGLLGLNAVITTPQILYALNPMYVLQFLSSLDIRQLMLFFGALVLAIAGVEAFYADLGHFGAGPIRLSWLSLVYPALILNYLGQGAFLLSHSAVIDGNIFYSMVPHTFIVPMVILAAFATAIASQALISGAYSLVAQAVALNYLPRVKIIHTNKNQEGQIYVPAVNWLLYIGSAALILHFGSSTALAGAYGFAVSGVMLTTSLAMIWITAIRWQWGWLSSSILFGAFAIVDLIFFVSKSYLFFLGGYVPAFIGVILFTVMMIWHWGRQLISAAYEQYESEHTIQTTIDLRKRLADGGGIVNDKRGQFVEAGRTVIFLTPKSVLKPEDQAPVILRVHMRHNGSIPSNVVLLHVERESRPYIRTARYLVTKFDEGMYGIEARFGFMEEINLERIVTYLKDKFEIPGLEEKKYLIEVGGEELRLDHENASWMLEFSVRFFRLLQRIAAPSYRYFGLAASSSLSTIAVPILVADQNTVIHMPELDLG